MELSVAEGRVLGCLIEKQVTELDAYSLTLDELRFSCNQTSGRDPVVAFDDRKVEDTLLALKAKGLSRFIGVGRNAGPVTYRHRADERWRLGRAELAVLSILLLRGPQSADQVWTLVDGLSLIDSPTEVEAVLDTLAGRNPTPLAARLARSAGPGGVSWVEVLTGRYTLDEPLFDSRAGGTQARDAWRGDELREPEPQQPQPQRQLQPQRQGEAQGRAEPLPTAVPTNPPARSSPTLVELADRLTSIERRLAGIEAALYALRGGGQQPPRPQSSPQPPSPTRAHR